MGKSLHLGQRRRVAMYMGSSFPSNNVDVSANAATTLLISTQICNIKLTYPHRKKLQEKLHKVSTLSQRKIFESILCLKCRPEEKSIFRESRDRLHRFIELKQHCVTTHNWGSWLCVLLRGGERFIPIYSSQRKHYLIFTRKCMLIATLIKNPTILGFGVLKIMLSESDTQQECVGMSLNE